MMPYAVGRAAAAQIPGWSKGAWSVYVPATLAITGAMASIARGCTTK